MGLFHEDFKAYAVDKKNKMRDIEVDTNNIFTGYDEGKQIVYQMVTCIKNTTMMWLYDII